MTLHWLIINRDQLSFIYECACNTDFGRKYLNFGSPSDTQHLISVLGIGDSKPQALTPQLFSWCSAISLHPRLGDEFVNSRYQLEEQMGPDSQFPFAELSGSIDQKAGAVFALAVFFHFWKEAEQGLADIYFNLTIEVVRR